MFMLLLLKKQRLECDDNDNESLGVLRLVSGERLHLHFMRQMSYISSKVTIYRPALQAAPTPLHVVQNH